MGAPDHPRRLDALFLALAVFLPALLYLPNLGFYSDDWAFFAAMEAAPNGSLRDFIARMLPAADLRPGHAVYAAVTYSLFGLAPAGYHLVNHLVILLLLVVLLKTLLRLGLSHAVALTATVVFGLMPSYSTLRFWFAAHMTNLSLLAYLLSLSIDLRPPASGIWAAVGWRAVSACMALLSVLLYELTMPLLLLNPLAAWWVRHGRLPLRAIRKGGALLGDRLLRLARGVLNHHGIVYGIGEPLSVWTVLTRYFDLATALVAVLAGLGVGLYLFQTLAWSPLVTPPATMPEVRRRLGLVVGLGLVVLVAGYLVFVTNDQFFFSAAGITNRISQIGSLGAALILTGLFGLVSSLLVPRQDRATIPAISSGSARGRQTLQRGVFCFLAGLYCGAGVLILGTIGSFWAEAYRLQTAIVQDLRLAVPTLAPGSALLLDGTCAYVGPAIVFESSWDLQGLVRLQYQDSTPRADVVSARLEIEETELWTWLSARSDHVSYPYASGIQVYNHRHGVVVPIRDAGEMERYLERYNRTRDNGCPFGWPGNGVTILPRPL